MSVFLPYIEEPDIAITSLLASKFHDDDLSILSDLIEVIESESEVEFIKSVTQSGLLNKRIEKNEIYQPDLEIESPLVVYKRKCDQFNTPPVYYLSDAIENHKKTINATGYGIDEINLYFMCEGLTGPPVKDLTKLILDHNYFSKIGCVTLANYIEDSAIKFLSLASCKIGAKGAALLAPSLEKTMKLKHLNLSHCDLRDEGGVVIAKALSNNRSIIDLDLSYNKLYSAAAKQLGSMLEKNQTIQILNLKWNELYQPEYAKFLAKSLGNNFSVRELNLSWNGLSGTKFAREFAKYLRKAISLCKLNLENNFLSDDDLPYIIAGLQKCVPLKECYMGGNRWTNQSMAFFLVGKYPSLDIFSFGEMGLEGNLYELAQLFMSKPNKKIIFGGQIRSKPPDPVNFLHVLFDRIKLVAMRVKKKKWERNMGHFMHLLLDQGKDLIKERDYDRLYAEFNPRLDDMLARQLKELYLIKTGKIKRVNVKEMAEAYLERHPTVKPLSKVQPPALQHLPPESDKEQGKK